jgi:hypothetical protein
MNAEGKGKEKVAFKKGKWNCRELNSGGCA